MCGRFTLRTPLTVLAQQFLFDLGEAPAATQVSRRYNIAPTQTVAAVRHATAAQGPFIVPLPSATPAPAASAKRELALFHWGLIPSWAKDAKIASSLINARSETLAEKPSFRTAFARRRCLILADGFYEWKKEGQPRTDSNASKELKDAGDSSPAMSVLGRAKKLPYYFQLAGEKPFAFAGLWERWRPPQADDAEKSNAEAPPIESCTIVTTTANELCAPFHDRMPVILDPAHYDLWLDPAITDTSRLLPLLLPLPASQMQTRPVNNVKNDDPAVLVAEQELF